jgi:electron transfer flavoprotein alpha/beta subunit
MNILVCIKQVPENMTLGLDRETGYARRSESKGVLNAADRHALELAIALKEAAGGKLIALSMGPTSAEQALRAALAMGFDEGYLVSDPALVGSDTGVTATVLAAAIRQVPDVGLVLTGEFSSDGATAQTAPRLAESLGWPLISRVYQATLADGLFSAGRNADTCLEQVEAPTPLVASVSLDAPKPRISNAMGVMKAAKKPLTTWSLDALGLTPEQAGASGSCTWVARSFKPEKREKGEILTGTAAEQAKSLVERLAHKNLIEV